MRKIILFFIFFLFVSISVQAQKYFTRSGNVSFHSLALLEEIDAFNNQGTFVLDIGTGQLQMAVLIKGFQFEKALMQEHFNENYMESNDFPKAFFRGRIISPSSLNFDVPGKIDCVLEGELTIRGISKPINIPAIFTAEEGKITGTATFPVTVADFDISIPSVVKDKIAKSVEIKVDVTLDPM